jgi:Helix-turn-helix domain
MLPRSAASRNAEASLDTQFDNDRSGLCFPSYERIAEAAGCARSTVAEALKALEDAGILSWVQRIKRVRERCSDLLGANGWRWRVLRTSNAYNFRDPGAPDPSKSEKPTGTPNQDFFSSIRGDTPGIIVAERVVATGLRDVWSRIARMAEDVDEPGCQIRVTEEAGGIAILIGVTAARCLSQHAAPRLRTPTIVDAPSKRAPALV